MSRKPSDEKTRFWLKVQKGAPEECWPWKGYLSNGYGLFRVGGKAGYRITAHRYSCQLVHGPIDAGMVVDHLCRNPCCVNPRHLEVVTQQVNLLRGVGPTATNAAKTHCKRGHEYTAENTILIPGGRWCRICRSQHASRYSKAARLRLRAAGVTKPRAKLTTEAVLMIRTSSEHLRAIARLLGVSESLIRQVRSGKIWKHVHG